MKLLRSGYPLRDLIKQLYTTFILPIVIYGVETWSMMKTHQKELLVFEKEILRTFFGAIIDTQTNELRIKKNEKLELLKPSEVRVHNGQCTSGETKIHCFLKYSAGKELERGKIPQKVKHVVGRVMWNNYEKD